jgi:hypothetical protein
MTAGTAAFSAGKYSSIAGEGAATNFEPGWRYRGALIVQDGMCRAPREAIAANTYPATRVRRPHDLPTDPDFDAGTGNERSHGADLPSLEKWFEPDRFG